MGLSKVHKHFKLASYFILLASCAGILKVITVYWDADISNYNTSIGLALNAVILLLFIWLALKISNGKNWARITFVVCAACMLIFAPHFILNELNVSKTAAGLSVVFSICLIIAILLLYSKGARQWYADQLSEK